jgi:hypothetical protein
MLGHHVVLDDRHRLRRAQIEVDVAKAADVEPRKDAAGGRFNVEAGDAARQRKQGVGTAGLDVVQGFGLHDGNGDRHAQDVLLAALRRDDDRVGRFRRFGVSRLGLCHGGSHGQQGGSREKRGG